MDRTTDNPIIKCLNCGTKNRLVLNKSTEKKAVCGQCGKILPEISTEPVIITDANFSMIVDRSPFPVLLDLWAAWCGPCRQLAPVIEQLARELAGRILVGKLNVDENRQTAARFGVQSIPTLLILQNGRETDRLVGLQTRDAILRRLQTFL